MGLKTYLPISTWLPNYSGQQFKGDLAAGLTVGVMLIPQGMAYAMIAGLPPIYGLYASTLPLIMYAILGTSRQLAVGPVAMDSLLTAAAIGVLAQSGTATYITLAISLAFMVGLIQFLLGVLRLGFLVNFLSRPVISGFTSAAALIIAFSQLKHLLGIEVAGAFRLHEIVEQLAEQIHLTNGLAVAVGLGGILIIKGVKRFSPALPAALVVVVFGILLVWGFGLDQKGLKIVGSVPAGLPSFAIPDLSWSTFQLLLPVALAISLVGFMESIAISKAVQAKHKDYKLMPNQELLALGAANMGGALFQSYPVTGGFSRTAVNDQAGAKTQLAAIISAMFILLTLLFLTPLFYYLPKAILASIIMVAVLGLIDIKIAQQLWHSHRSDFWMLIITFLATLLLGIQLGIGIGVLLSLAVIIYETSRPHIAILGKVPGTIFYRNLERFSQVENREDLLIIRFDARLYFANLDHFRDKIEDWIAEKGEAMNALIIDAEGMNNLDSSGLQFLEEIVDELRTQGRKIYFTDVKGPVRDMLVRGKLYRKIGGNNFFMSVQQAVDYHDAKQPQEDAKHKFFTSQHNVNKSLRNNK